MLPAARVCHWSLEHVVCTVHARSEDVVFGVDSHWPSSHTVSGAHARLLLAVGATLWCSSS